VPRSVAAEANEAIDTLEAQYAESPRAGLKTAL